MNKKFTLLLIPDDESGTKSYSISKNLLRFIFIIMAIILIGLIILTIKSVPSVNKYAMLNEKYNKLAQERMKVIELADGLKRIKQMNEFVRNSLGAEFNFPQNPEMMDSVLMLIPDDNFISFSDNIPSFAPIKGFISQRMEKNFSMVENLHNGIDIVAKQGTPIKASASGLVIFSGWTYEMGNQIILYHGDGYFTHYGHNQQNLKYQLDIVKRGEVIGLVGNSGISSGPHLHFEIWKDNKSIDPLLYFPELKKTDLTSN
ncbi:MAG: hypothetical protein CMG41_01975 [Candidatus Marinimicrobia bacterium]|nr:hypothetical protein [Candidatus Neomarinimicrobiota bacterium]|tara:strand:+ start:44 stop:820 length:777 start_codon:yes stop_codon:yes gene_type:complete